MSKDDGQNAPQFEVYFSEKQTQPWDVFLIGCTAAEDEGQEYVSVFSVGSSGLQWPGGYDDSVLNGDPEKYLRNMTDYASLD